MEGMNFFYKLILCNCAGFFMMNVAFSETIVNKAAVGEQNLKIIYGSSSWNLDSTTPDSSFLFLRDRSTGKVVKIQLEESEPDSSIFTGNFSVTWGTAARVEAEVYIPPRSMKDNDEAIKKFNQLLSKNQIQPKPYIVKSDPYHIRVLDVYDTPEQAARAQKVYQEEEQARLEQEKNKNLIKPAVRPQELEVAKKAEQAAVLHQLNLESIRRQSERVRLEQIERQKAEERIRQAQALSEKQRELRKKEAVFLAQEALQHYQKGEFVESEAKFHKSVDLDPEEKSYYFRYGVTLYRNEKFNEALVILKLAPEDPATLLEKKYYMGLSLLRLKELDLALQIFRDVGAHKESPLAASSSFYEGIILFTQEEYEAAKEPFERVLDTSSDPKLDQQAEEYLDRLVGLIQQKKAMAKRMWLNGSLGGMYDSNVLLAPDTETSQGTATKEGDFRLLLAGDIEYRPLYTTSHEWGVKASSYSIRSSKTSVSLADPFLWNLSAPYTYKGLAFGKGYKLAIKPAYEVLYMDENSDGRQENVLLSSIVGVENTFVMHKNWFSTYSIELRNDDSQSSSSEGVENADALKISLKTSQTFLLNKQAQEAIMALAGYVINNAKGNNKFYSRYELGATYLRPVKKTMTINLGLAYYFVDYSKKTTKREDSNLSFSAGVTKPIKEWVSWNVTGVYSNNASTDPAGPYSKYTVLATALFNYAL